MKEVNYVVTGDFGNSPKGEKRKAILILKDGNRALLYHPRGKGTCGSLEVCVNDGDYRSANDSWMNIDSAKDIAKVIKVLSEIDYKNTREKIIGV